MTFRRVEQAFADALIDVPGRFGAVVDAYMRGHRNNVGNPLCSIENLKELRERVERVTPGAWADPAVTEHLRRRFRDYLPDATSADRQRAGELLAEAIGGDARTYANTWSTFPPP